MNQQPESPAQTFQRKLKVSESLADKLVAGGITTLEEVAYVPFEELRKIAALSEEETMSLRNQARECLLREAIGGGSLGDLAKGMPDA
jgi:N utilization substance protein A